MTGRRSRHGAALWMVRMFSCLLAAHAVPAVAREPVPDWTIDNVRQTVLLAPEVAVEVWNPYGDVRLRAADAGEVEMSATFQRRLSDPAKGALTVARRRGRLTIAVVYPRAPQGDLHRSDLTVFVPAGARVAVHTLDGMIQARGLANDVVLKSAGGNVFVSTTGTARVAAGRGNISAQLGPQRWRRSPRLATRDGHITLTLPANPDARVRIRARGKIVVQAPTNSDHRSTGKAIVTLGRGSQSLCLRTKRGSVTLVTSAAG